MVTSCCRPLGQSVSVKRLIRPLLHCSLLSLGTLIALIGAGRGQQPRRAFKAAKQWNFNDQPLKRSRSGRAANS